MSEAKFRIRRLKPDQRTSPGQDFYTTLNGLCCWCEKEYTLSEYSQPHYRISLAQPVAEPASEAPAEAGEQESFIDYVDRQGSFADDLKKLINRHSLENDSNTPDYVLADYLSSCLTAYVAAIAMREEHGRIPAPASVPSVDLWQHEREELRKAIEALRNESQRHKEERDWQHKANTTILNQFHEVCKDKQALTAERDDLRQQLEAAKAELAAMSDKLHQAGIQIGELQSQLAAAKPAAVQYAWREPTPNDAARGYKARVRDSESSEWESDESRKYLRKHHGGSWITTTWCGEGEAFYRFCQVYAPVEAEAAKPAPQEEWRTPTDEDARQRPYCEVRDYGDEQWKPRKLMAVIRDNCLPFFVFNEQTKATGLYRFARVRKEVSRD